MCELVHNVELKNVQNRETFHYPVVLLKGVLADPCCDGKLKLAIANGSTFLSFSVALENKWQHFDEKKPQESCQPFRVLLRLLPGENEYEVRYCNTRIFITLTYTTPDTLYTVLPLYIICKGHTGHYQSDESQKDSQQACRKITLATELLQCLYAEKLLEHGFGRKTFILRSPCQLFHSELDSERAATMTEGELWHTFATELVRSKRFDLERVKVVAFLSSTHFAGIADGDYSYENIRRRTTGHAALGGGGLALFGTGCLYTWPATLETVCSAFSNQRPVDCARQLDDSNYRRTYGGCFATTLGSVCHEMGHTFDLGHTPDGSIMGDGVDGIDSVFVGTTQEAHGPKRRIDTKPHGLAGKLTQLKRPGDVLRQRLEFKKNDGFFFAPISALTLAHQRWFNYARGFLIGSMHFDRTTRTVTCASSTLVLAELRSTGNGMMQKCWTFRQDGAPRTFTLPKLPNLQDQTLFVMDASGNVLKVDLNSISTTQVDEL
uniref:Uncharacterized protein n=1 Tax=Anopheles farauti TaxID=69004 RepID=A0A182QZI5_9DIPT